MARYIRLIGSGNTSAGRARRTRQPGGLQVLWENPRGPRRGVIIERRQRGMVYRRRVGPLDYLTMAEAAEVLGTYRMQVYRLARSGELMTRVISGMRVVTLAELKRVLGQV